MAKNIDNANTTSGSNYQMTYYCIEDLHRESPDAGLITATSASDTINNARYNFNTTTRTVVANLTSNAVQRFTTVKRMRVSPEATEAMNTGTAESAELKEHRQRGVVEITHISPNVTMNYELGFDTHNDLFTTALGNSFQTMTGTISADLDSNTAIQDFDGDTSSAERITFTLSTTEEYAARNSLFALNTYITLQNTAGSDTQASRTNHYRIIQREQTDNPNNTVTFALTLEGLVQDYQTEMVQVESLEQFNDLDVYYGGDIITEGGVVYYAIGLHDLNNNNMPNEVGSMFVPVTDNDEIRVGNNYTTGQVAPYIGRNNDGSFYERYARAYKQITGATAEMLPVAGDDYQDYWSLYNEYNRDVKTSYNTGEVAFHNDEAFVSLTDNNADNPLNGTGVIYDSSMRNEFTFKTYMSNANPAMSDHVLFNDKYYRTTTTSIVSGTLPTDTTHFTEITVTEQALRQYSAHDILRDGDDYYYVPNTANALATTSTLANYTMLTDSSNPSLHTWVPNVNYQPTTILGSPGPEHNKLVYKLSGNTPTYLIIDATGINNHRLESAFTAANISGLENAIGSSGNQVDEIFAWSSSAFSPQATTHRAYVYDPADPTQVYYWNVDTYPTLDTATTFEDFINANYTAGSVGNKLRPVSPNMGATTPQGVVRYVRRTTLNHSATDRQYIENNGTIYLINADVNGTQQLNSSTFTLQTIIDYEAPTTYTVGDYVYNSTSPNVIYIAKANNGGQLLTNDTYFTRILAPDFQMALRSYAAGDVVYLSGSPDVFYRALVDVPISSNQRPTVNTSNSYFELLVATWQHAATLDTTETYEMGDYILSSAGILYRKTSASAMHTTAQLVEGTDFTAVAARNNSLTFSEYDSSFDPAWELDESYVEGEGIGYEDEIYGIKENVYNTTNTTRPDVDTTNYSRITPFEHSKIGTDEEYDTASSLGNFVVYQSSNSSHKLYLRLHNPALRQVIGSSFSQYYNYFSEYNLYEQGNASSYVIGDIVYVDQHAIAAVVGVTGDTNAIIRTKRDIATQTPFIALVNAPQSAPSLNLETGEGMTTSDWLALTEYSSTTDYVVSSTPTATSRFRVGSVVYEVRQASSGTVPPTRYLIGTGTTAAQWAQPVAIRNGMSEDEFTAETQSATHAIEVTVNPTTEGLVNNIESGDTVNFRYSNSYLRNGDDDYYYNMEIKRGEKYFFYRNALISSLGLNFNANGYIGGAVEWMTGGIASTVTNTPRIPNDLDFTKGEQNNLFNVPITTGSKIVGFYIRPLSNENITNDTALRKQSISDVGYTSITNNITLNVPETNVIGHDARYDPRRGRFDIEVTLNILYSTREPFIQRLLNSNQRVFEMCLEARDQDGNFLLFTMPSLQITNYTVSSTSAEDNQTATITCRATASNSYGTTIQIDRIPRSLS